MADHRTELAEEMARQILHPRAPDAQLPIIVQALRHSAADVEISRAKSLGDLATTLFNRICLSDGPTGGFYSSETNQALTVEIGMPVSRSAIQNALLALTDANLVMSTGKGRYDATDPFVKIAWRESRGLASALSPDEEVPGDGDKPPNS